MIGSFWNLCRTCPSMPVDKLHSEYRSTYRWHEYTGSRQDDVIRKAPQANGTAVAVSGEIPNAIQSAVPSKQDDTQNECKSIKKVIENGRVVSYIMSPVLKMEPALPRRKKHPELAYRHHEFITNEADLNPNIESSSFLDRTRSEVRGGGHWKPSRRSKSEGPSRTNPDDTTDNGERRRESDPDIDNMNRDAGLIKKAISKISTEYRLQFAWPQGHISRRDKVDASCTPRKSLSMGAIKPSVNAIVHRKRTDHENKDESELEPLVVNDATIHEDARENKVQGDVDFKTEYKKKFRPFSQYEYTDGRFLERNNKCNENVAKEVADNNKGPWYREVVELRKKAGEYKYRGWGTELAPERIAELYNKQLELWDQVSQRSSLSALSLASTAHRSYTKDEKDESNKRSTPASKSLRNTDSRITRELIRHHLERTTGGSEMDGLILSPTREKLEPTIPRKDDGYRSTKGSPQKSSPLKSSPQKSSQKKTYQKPKTISKNVRSQSLDPAEVRAEKPKSPKHQSRSATTKEKKQLNNNISTLRKSRPSSLSTTSRSKSNFVKTEDKQQAKPSSKQNVSHVAAVKQPSGVGIGRAGESTEKSFKNEVDEVQTQSNFEAVDLEPVVKSPPEPTRVKSPEQILVRSPDPVNWTVPLDTGKTFTVTQNIPESDFGVRSCSEAKVWTPPELPPPIAQSAPPQLPMEQIKEQGMSIS
ncbi:nuclear protein MDM1 isoform X3 [Agrilus planipennis]|uniref:Nuclear protein MDM1 n=1 Tax=Agrilus planipennis TaxID=224129 RepID=A0A1W4WT75_AGRPL|nr:nuclear protein MDM1 isoform X3 [Agrilus planipennis]